MQQANPGFVSVVFAEEKWAEREAAVAAQIAHLQALVEAGLDAASEASPSEAGDNASAEQLEDDESWGKVEKSKRKAVLCRQPDALAKKLRTSLAKVSSAASPFIKKRHA